MQVWILYSTLAFFALVRQANGLKISFLKIVAYLAFQMLQRREENF